MIHTAAHPSRRSRRDERDLRRRGVVEGRGARGRWWYRIRGIIGLVVVTVTAAILLAGAVLTFAAIAAYLVRSLSG